MSEPIIVHKGTQLVVYPPFGDTNCKLFIAESDEKPIRKYLKKRKAAKKAERRFYAAWNSDTPEKSVYWVVRDRDDDGALHGQFPHHECSEADARAFAKLLNKQARKQATS